MRCIGFNQYREEHEVSVCVVSHQLVQGPELDCKLVEMEQHRAKLGGQALGLGQTWLRMAVLRDL